MYIPVWVSVRAWLSPHCAWRVRRVSGWKLRPLRRATDAYVRWTRPGRSRDLGVTRECAKLQKRTSAFFPATFWGRGRFSAAIYAALVFVCGGVTKEIGKTCKVENAFRVRYLFRGALSMRSSFHKIEISIVPVQRDSALLFDPRFYRIRWHTWSSANRRNVYDYVNPDDVRGHM